MVVLYCNRLCGYVLICFCECAVTRAVNIMDAVTITLKHTDCIPPRPVLAYNRMDLGFSS